MVETMAGWLVSMNFSRKKGSKENEGRQRGTFSMITYTASNSVALSSFYFSRFNSNHCSNSRSIYLYDENDSRSEWRGRNSSDPIIEIFLDIDQVNSG